VGWKQVKPGASETERAIPERSMRVRRWLTIIALALVWFFLWKLLPKLPGKDLLPFAQGLMMLYALIWTIYFTGATANDLAQIAAAFHININKSTMDVNSTSDSRIEAPPDWSRPAGGIPGLTLPQAPDPYSMDPLAGTPFELPR
jgi:hypothetical protein